MSATVAIVATTFETVIGQAVKLDRSSMFTTCVVAELSEIVCPVLIMENVPAASVPVKLNTTARILAVIVAELEIQ